MDEIYSVAYLTPCVGKRMSRKPELAQQWLRFLSSFLSVSSSTKRDQRLRKQQIEGRLEFFCGFSLSSQSDQ